MKHIVKIVLCLLSLTLSAGIALAVDAKAPAKPTAETKAAAPVKDAKPAADAKAAKKELVDINTATETDLKGIAGIGDAYAAKIIAGRPYAKKDQLKSRSILPAVVYEKVKDQIIAKQPPKETKPAAAPAKEAKPVTKDGAKPADAKKK